MLRANPEDLMVQKINVRRSIAKQFLIVFVNFWSYYQLTPMFDFQKACFIFYFSFILITFAM